MLFVDKIFNYFSGEDKRTDTNKDVNEKGTLERYNESIGEDIDENIKPLLDYLLANVCEPITCYDRYVPYIESELGYSQEVDILFLGSTIARRRQVVQKILRYYPIRGSRRGYEVLFNLLGITLVSLTEYDIICGLDSPLTIDDDDRRLDGCCDVCTRYSLELSGGVSITVDILRAIESIITFNQPIHAILEEVSYNGSPLGLTFDYSLDYSLDYNS
jgi:hypothetical protein